MKLEQIVLTYEQFPMSEYVKDPVSGWKSIAYDSAGQKKTTVVDGAPVTAEGMDEEGDDGGSEIEDVADGSFY